jgi:hypothetical protein
LDGAGVVRERRAVLQSKKFEITETSISSAFFNGRMNLHRRLLAVRRASRCARRGWSLRRKIWCPSESDYAPLCENAGIFVAL